MRFRSFLLLVFLVLLAGSGTAWVQTTQAQPAREGSIPREDFVLHYRTVGSGAPLLLLSGGPGFEVDYMSGIAQELGRSYQCILLEQRGTGRSRLQNPTPAGMRLALLVEDVEAVRTALHADKLIILGHSWGGMLAMAYAASYPERVESLILVDSGGMDLSFAKAFSDNVTTRASMSERRELENAEAAMEHASDARALDAASAAYARLQTPFYFYNRSLADQLLAMEPANANQQRVFGLMQDDLMNHYHVRAALQSFARPALILQGRQDPMPETVAIEIHETLRNSHLTFIDECGHFPWIEQPQAFFSAVRAFLAKQQ